jgi:hypothetical protein
MIPRSRELLFSIQDYDCVVEIPVYFPDNNHAPDRANKFFWNTELEVTINNKSMRRRERSSFAPCSWRDTFTCWVCRASVLATCTRDVYSRQARCLEFCYLTEPYVAAMRNLVRGALTVRCFRIIYRNSVTYAARLSAPTDSCCIPFPDRTNLAVEINRRNIACSPRG